MSKKDEALKLALEALLGWGKGFPDNWGDLDTEAITAIREALAEQPAQQEPEQSEIFCGVDFADGLLSVSVLRRRADDVAELLHLEQIALPAQQQEPYGWKVYGVNSLFMGEFAEADAKAEAKRIGGTCITFPLYTSPPASKPWVGLTDEELSEIYNLTEWDIVTEWEYERAIEAKLKEKNNA